MTPAQQAWFDLVKLLIAALLGFLFGTGGRFLEYYALNRDKRLRLLEREGKKHKFWKDFFDTQNALPETARYSERDMKEATQTCQQELSRSYEEVMGHTLRADIYSKGLASLACAGVLLLFWLPGYGEFLFGLLTLGNRMPQDAPSFQRVGFEVSLFLFFRLVFYSWTYRPIRDRLKRRFLDRQRKGLTLLGLD